MIHLNIFRSSMLTGQREPLSRVELHQGLLWNEIVAKAANVMGVKVNDHVFSSDAKESWDEGTHILLSGFWLWMT